MKFTFEVAKTLLLDIKAESYKEALAELQELMDDEPELWAAAKRVTTETKLVDVA